MTIKIEKQLNYKEQNKEIVNAAVRQTQQSVNDLINNSIPSAIMTTRGDMIYDGASGPTRLAVGSAGSILASNGTDPFWSSRQTVQASTSGSSIAFTGIPAGVCQVLVVFDQVSLSGTNDILIQIGDAGGIETSGYTSISSTVNTAGSAAATASTAGFIIRVSAADRQSSGVVSIVNITGQTWIASGDGGSQVGANPDTFTTGGSKTLSPGPLDRVTITVTGADTFDNGQINIVCR